MACTIALTKSRNLNCVTSKVGIRSISIIQFDPLDRVVTTAAGVVTLPDYMLTATAPAGAKIARFDVKNTTTNYTDTLTNNMDTRSGGRKGELPLVLVSSTGVDNIELSGVIDQLTKTEFVAFFRNEKRRYIRSWISIWMLYNYSSRHFRWSRWRFERCNAYNSN